MSDKRQNTQFELAFPAEERGEAPRAVQEGTESLAAKRQAERPAMGEQLMEAVCEWTNVTRAVGRVKANKGSAGVDGMTVQPWPAHRQQSWPTLRVQLLRATDVPQPVKRVAIAKPDGGKRPLGIPTVVDRVIQQAVLQVLPRIGDRTFSDSSDGVRPGRSAQQAVEQGLVSPLDAGTPQGGPLAPLLSNIVLDELAREVERRGLRFVRYADDGNIYVCRR